MYNKMNFCRFASKIPRNPIGCGFEVIYDSSDKCVGVMSSCFLLSGKKVIKLMLEKVVAAPTMYSYKYEEHTNLSACPVPYTINSSTSRVVLEAVLRMVVS